MAGLRVGGGRLERGGRSEEGVTKRGKAVMDWRVNGWDGCSSDDLPRCSDDT